MFFKIVKPFILMSDKSILKYKHKITIILLIKLLLIVNNYPSY